MKMLNWIAMILAVAMLLCGCSKSEDDVLTLESLFYRTEVAMQEGQLFFAGKVLNVVKQDRAITYYERETIENTFYEVEVTEDFFGFMPERTLTVCVMGTGEHFVSRTELNKGEEYIFQVQAWAGEEEMLFLLPTFYEAMPQKDGEYLYYTKGNSRYAVDGGYEEYKQMLLDLADQYSYTAQGVGESIFSNLQEASKRNAAYFEKLEFKTIDRATLDSIAAFAAARSKINAPKNAQEIKEILK